MPKSKRLNVLSRILVTEVFLQYLSNEPLRAQSQNVVNCRLCFVSMSRLDPRQHEMFKPTIL